MLAGVAFTDAGVRILLLLLGVTPSDKQTEVYIRLKMHACVLDIKHLHRRSVEMKGLSLTWYRLLVVVFKPAEESIDCGEYL